MFLDKGSIDFKNIFVISNKFQKNLVQKFRTKKIRAKKIR